MMWDGTIPPEGSHFQLRNEVCQISDKENILNWIEGKTRGSQEPV